MHNSDQILSMYTNEAVKCGRYTLYHHADTHLHIKVLYTCRLEKTIKGMTEVTPHNKNITCIVLHVHRSLRI